MSFTPIFEVPPAAPSAPIPAAPSAPILAAPIPQPVSEIPEFSERTYFINNKRFDLSDDQYAALQLGKAGQNLFITGEPGSGKTLLVRALEIEFHRQRKSVVFLAPTGLAALALGGSTFHRFFKFPTKPLSKDIGLSMGKSFKMRDLVHATDVFVIDEMSMVRADLFTAMDLTLRSATNKPDVPFGGKQIIGVGDFYQLPPVVTDPTIGDWLHAVFGGVLACHCMSWHEAQLRVTPLVTNHRQSDDSAFNHALNLIRIRNPQGLALINQMATVTSELQGTIITFTNDSAQMINSRKLAEIDRESFKFIAERDEKGIAPVDSEIELKVGARVMLAANTNEFVNGDLGIVEQINSDSIQVKLDRGPSVKVERYVWDSKDYRVNSSGQLVDTVVGSFKQLPVRLGWAITAHKSQGQTLDKVTLLMDTRPFESGQLYVALSRVRRASDLYLGRPLDGMDLK